MLGGVSLLSLLQKKRPRSVVTCYVYTTKTESDANIDELVKMRKNSQHRNGTRLSGRRSQIAHGMKDGSVFNAIEYRGIHGG